MNRAANPQVGGAAVDTQFERYAQWSGVVEKGVRGTFDFASEGVAVATQQKTGTAFERCCSDSW